MQRKTPTASASISAWRTTASLLCHFCLVNRARAISTNTAILRGIRRSENGLPGRRPSVRGNDRNDRNDRTTNNRYQRVRPGERLPETRSGRQGHQQGEDVKYSEGYARNADKLIPRQRKYIKEEVGSVPSFQRPSLSDRSSAPPRERGPSSGNFSRRSDHYRSSNNGRLRAKPLNEELGAGQGEFSILREHRIGYGGHSGSERELPSYSASRTNGRSFRRDRESRMLDRFAEDNGSQSRKDSYDGGSSSDRIGQSRTPLSIPYTTPASEFLYGTSVVIAALQARRRKLYKLYVYNGEQREAKTLAQAESTEKLAHKHGVAVSRVDGDGIRLLDKMSTGRPHNVNAVRLDCFFCLQAKCPRVSSLKHLLYPNYPFQDSCL